MLSKSTFPIYLPLLSNHYLSFFIIIIYFSYCSGIFHFGDSKFLHVTYFFHTQSLIKINLKSPTVLCSRKNNKNCARNSATTFAFILCNLNYPTPSPTPWTTFRIFFFCWRLLRVGWGRGELGWFADYTAQPVLAVCVCVCVQLLVCMYM